MLAATMSSNCLHCSLLSRPAMRQPSSTRNISAPHSMIASIRTSSSRGFLAGARITGHNGIVSGSRSRRITVTQAGLGDRVSRVAKGYTFFYGDKAAKSLEDPRKMLDQAVSEMKEDLVKMRQASAEVFSTQKMLETKYTQAQASADQWYRRAQLALDKGEEELARDALRRKKTFSDTALMLKKQLDQHTRATSQLTTNIRMMESKVAEAMSKKETLKARALSAETTKQLNESIVSMVSGLKSSTSGSLAAFERMEQKVVAMEAEADAVGQLGGGSGDALEGKFALLEGGFSGVEDDFQQMKKNMAESGRLGSKPPVQKPTTIFWTS
ncbi:hypothetical protein ABBQ32_012958 [Trebouxia sp. C0010 RCD-2024]